MEPSENTKDLAAHNCLIHSVKAPTGIWQFRRGSDAFRVRVAGSLSSNFGDAIRSAALIGAGISMHPTYVVDDDIRAGRLRVLMPDFIPTSLEIRAIYTRRDLPLRVSLFLDHLHGWLKRKTSWTEPQRRAWAVAQRCFHFGTPYFRIHSPLARDFAHIGRELEIAGENRGHHHPEPEHPLAQRSPMSISRSR